MTWRKEQGRSPLYSADIDVLEALVILLDSYSINRFADPKRLNERIRKTQSRAFVSYWKDIQEVIHKMARVPPSIPEVQTMLKISSAARFVSTVIFTVIFSFVFLSITRVVSWLSTGLLGVISGIGFAIVITGSFLSFYLERKTAARIQDRFGENPTTLAKERAYMKRTAQELIDHIRERLRADGDDPSTHTMELQSVVYRGLRVIKQPSFLRKTYRVIPEL